MEKDETKSPYEVYTINEFIVMFKMSRATYYNLKSAGNLPKTLKFMNKILITREAIDNWVKENSK